MRILAIGDIHGCFRSLSRLVEAARLTEDDLLITLGDYVNRGPQSREVIEWLIGHHRTGGLIPLRGNHELMMTAARKSESSFDTWMSVGGKQTVASYGSEQTCTRAIPDRHWDFLEDDLLDYFETDTHIFVHANAYRDLPMSDQPPYILYWEHLEDETSPHESGKTIICGHTSQKSGVPRNLGHTICIDTAACKGGWLTCLEVNTGYYWQANEAGEIREQFL